MSAREQDRASEVVARQSAEHQPAAVAWLEARGYTVRKEEAGGWVAEAGALRVMGGSPLALLGLHAILVERGWAWQSRPGEPDLDTLVLTAKQGVRFNARGEAE